MKQDPLDRDRRLGCLIRYIADMATEGDRIEFFKGFQGHNGREAAVNLWRKVTEELKRRAAQDAQKGHHKARSSKSDIGVAGTNKKRP